MSRSVSAPSSVTKTSPCWNGFIVPGSTFRYGSSFCIVTRRPREVSNWPRLEAVSPLPREDATPPVTKTCLVVRACCTNGAPVKIVGAESPYPRAITLTRRRSLSAPRPGRSHHPIGAVRGFPEPPPARAEIRNRCHVTFDVAGSVAGAVHDRSAAWRFIEGFAAAWTEPIGPEDGWSRRELAEAEDRLGVGLPEAVKEALSLFGKRPEVTSNHDRLLAPAELFLDGEALVFRSDQWIEAWGVRLAGDDPEVLVRHDFQDKHQYPWKPWMPCFSLARVELVLSMAVFGHGLETADRERKDADVPLLDEHFTLLPLT